MSKGKKRRRSQPGGYRQPAAAPAGRPAASQGGLLGRVFGPPVPAAMSQMPTFRRSLGQGFLLVATNPALVVGPFLLVLVVWLALLALGFVGSPLALSQALAIPPVSTAFDTQNAVSVAGQRAGLMAALGILLVRAIVVALLAAAIVEGFERTGRVSGEAVRRGLVALPRVLAYMILSFTALFLAQLGALFGPGIGTLVQVILPALVLYVLGFLPFVAVRQRLPLAESLRRSLVAARTPGGRHLSFSVLYVLFAFLLPIFLPRGTLITANPAAVTWAGVLVLTLVHVGFTAALGYRWLAVEAAVSGSETTEPAPR